MTDEQLQHHLSLPANKMCPRRLDLQKMGLVHQIGTGKTTTGRKAKLWALVPQDGIQAARIAASERKERRKTIFEASVEDQVRVVQALLRSDAVNAALLSLEGRSGERARGRARGARSQAERERRELKQQIEDAERENAWLVRFLKAKRNLSNTLQVLNSVLEFIDLDAAERRNFDEPLIPLQYLPEVRGMLSDVMDLAGNARTTIDRSTGADGDDIIDAEVLEVTDYLLPESTY
jgi:hypothetical protein